MATTDIAAADSVEIDLGDDRRPGESDQKAIERALAKIASAGAGTLYLPPKRYVLHEPLVVAGAYVTITGDPGTVLHLHLVDSAKADTRSHVLALTGEIHRACFRGLTIIGPGGHPAAGREAALLPGERGACIGTAESALVHSLVVEDCVLSDRIVGVWLQFPQTVRGPFRFRRNRVRRVVRGLEVSSTTGAASWSGAAARDVRFERNHILVERGSPFDSRALTTVATLDVRLYANNLSGAGMAFEQGSPWFDTLERAGGAPPANAPEFPDVLTDAGGEDLTQAMRWELRHRISTRYNFVSLNLSQTHDLTYNVFDGRRQAPDRAPYVDDGVSDSVVPVVELAHTFPMATGNLVAHYEPGRFKALFQGITTRRRGVTGTGNVFWRLTRTDDGTGAFNLHSAAREKTSDGVRYPTWDTRGSSVLAANLVDGCNRFVGFPGPPGPGDRNDSLVMGSNLASQLAKEAVSAVGWRTVSLAGSIFREAYQNPVGDAMTGSGRDEYAAVELSGCASVTFGANAITQPPRLPKDRGFSRPVNSTAGSELTLSANFFANGNPQANQTQEEVSPPGGLGPPVSETPLARVVGATLKLEAENVLSYFNSTYELKESTQLLPIISGETP